MKTKTSTSTWLSDTGSSAMSYPLYFLFKRLTQTVEVHQGSQATNTSPFRPEDYIRSRRGLVGSVLAY